MRIRLLVPSAPCTRNGNTVTAERWRAFFEAMGHAVSVNGDPRAPWDVLVALNASKSRQALLDAKRARPEARIALCLTGTDLYCDLREDPGLGDVLYLADRLVVLQPAALDDLPPPLREKTTVIYQSARPPGRAPCPSTETFDVCVIAHLRDVKDPLRTAAAARLLPPRSKIRVLHVGKALSEDLARAAEREAAVNPRFCWLGEQTKEGTEGVLLKSSLLVLSSILEGGANVVSEAVVAGVPVLATRIACAVGLLGEDYPGLFPVGDTRRLSELLL
ncbi:MAG: glycosyltransferase, partial [Deltaproteobacteria bacterium]|nr:glycosyltransferase [Deltaproteobacteria bacterium]